MKPTNPKPKITEHAAPTFTDLVCKYIKKIPRGKVATYGQIAAYAGNPRGARQVVRILNSCSEKYELPWYRVINRLGRIALPKGGGYEVQVRHLRKEGVRLDIHGQIDLTKHLWKPRKL